MIHNKTNYDLYPLISGPLSAENIKVLQGANYYSAGPVVLIRLDLGKYDEVFTNQISGFYEKLVKSLPSLVEHHCSEAKRGGFLLRVEEGTLLGHVIEHIAIELQTLAGMDAGYGKTRSTLKQGVYHIIFRFLDEEAGIYAGKAAVNLVNSLLVDIPFDISIVIENLIDIREKNLLGPSTQAIVDEAERRKIPFLRLDSYNLVQLGTGKYNKRIRATITSDTNLIAVETADNKYLTTLMLKDAGIPVPETKKTTELNEVIAFWKEWNTAIVIKPSESYLGKFLRLNLNDEKSVEEAFHYAMQFNQEVIVQPYIPSRSFRLLVINFKFVAAVELVPPFIRGDGINDIQQLINILNADPARQTGDKSILSKVMIDDITHDIIRLKAYTLSTVLKEGEILFLKNSGNMRLGGSAIDVTDQVHPFIVFLAERSAKVINLNVAGVDILTDDISKAIDNQPGFVLEVNAAPDFRMHMMPQAGLKRNVAADLLNMLFPADTAFRVPVFSITGSYGKTTVVNILNYCLEMEGCHVGLASSEGIFINGKHLIKENATFAEHASLVLKDTTIDCAVFETSCEGILRKGIGYRFADYGVVLNITEEHLEKDDIKYIEDIAYAKSVVAEQVYDDGYVILNADNIHILEMINRAYGTIVLFSEKNDNPAVISHTFRGGTAIYLHNNIIVYHSRGIIKNIISLDEIPLKCTETGKPLTNSMLAVFAILLVHKVKEENIIHYLKNYLLS